MKQIAFHDSQQLRSAQIECRLMSEITHRYVTKYVDSFVAEKKLYLVMEYCVKGDLADYLHRCNFWLEERRIWQFFIQICLGLEVIHKKGVVHADLKPSNILL